MIESGQVPKKSLGKYQKNLGKYQKNPGEYQKNDRTWASVGKVIEPRQVPAKGPGEYRNSGRIWASTREGSG